MPSRFGSGQFVSKWKYFLYKQPYWNTENTNFSRLQKHSVKLQCMLWQANRVCCGGMTIPSRTINIYIWEPVEISSCCIRARMSPYFLDCAGLLFDLYKRIYIVNSHVKVSYWQKVLEAENRVRSVRRSLSNAFAVTHITLRQMLGQLWVISCQGCTTGRHICLT
jgi:hypothetical protein